MNQNIKYETVDVTLLAGNATGEKDIRLPNGVVTHIAVVSAGNDDNDIINLEILDNNSRVLAPADLRFSEKTANGDFLSSLRPVSGIDAGKVITAKLIALKPNRANNITAQVLFVVQPKEIY